MKLLPIHCSRGSPFSEKRPKLQVTDYITKKVDFRNNGFRAKMRHVWRLASWGMAFLLKQVCSRTTFVYHKKSECERYKTYPVFSFVFFDTGGISISNVMSCFRSEIILHPIGLAFEALRPAWVFHTMLTYSYSLQMSSITSHWIALGRLPRTIFQGLCRAFLLLLEWTHLHCFILLYYLVSEIT